MGEKVSDLGLKVLGKKMDSWTWGQTLGFRGWAWETLPEKDVLEGESSMACKEGGSEFWGDGRWAKNSAWSKGGREENKDTLGEKRERWPWLVESQYLLTEVWHLLEEPVRSLIWAG